VLQACTTDSRRSLENFDTLDDKKCGGSKRMFKWNNKFYVDEMSGRCEPRNFRPKSAEWFITSLENAKGRAPTAAELKQLVKFTFKTDEGLQLDQNLQCVVHKAAGELGIGQIPEDSDFRFVDWYPDNRRSPCCGYHCQTCPGGLPEDASPYYCAKNSPVRPSRTAAAAHARKRALAPLHALACLPCRLCAACLRDARMCMQCVHAVRVHARPITPAQPALCQRRPALCRRAPPCGSTRGRTATWSTHRATPTRTASKPS
jgi:hypothetical protein